WRSAMAIACLAVGASPPRRRSRTTKSFPDPCILMKSLGGMAALYGQRRARVHAAPLSLAHRKIRSQEAGRRGEAGKVHTKTPRKSMAPLRGGAKQDMTKTCLRAPLGAQPLSLLPVSPPPVPFLLFHAQQLDFELERGVRRDDPAAGAGR